MSLSAAAIVAGVGPDRGLGAALANCFAEKGLHVFVAGCGEHEVNTVVQNIHVGGGSATPIVADITVEEDLIKLFGIVQEKGKRLDIAAYNVGSNMPASFLETDTKTFAVLWRQNCLGAFLFAKQTIRIMQIQQYGTLFFTGASASLHARPPYTAFASAKAALRALSLGLAREFSPQGIHVVHAMIEGDWEWTRLPESENTKDEGGLLKPEAIAQTFWAIHQQHRGAWTHELDLRPFNASF